MDEDLEGSGELFVAGLSTRFTDLPGNRVDAEIERALCDLCEFLGTDRATLLEFAVDGASLAPTHSWVRPLVERYANSLFREEVPWYHAQLVRGESIRFARMPDQLPAEAQEEREVVLASGIKSILTTPIAVGGRFVCALSTAVFREHRTWSDATVARVRPVGQILANAIHRQRAEAKLLAQLAEIRQLQARLEAENIYLREEVALSSSFADIVGQSPALQSVLGRVAQAAPTPTTVLLLGETGTGKELLARAIHDRSPRRGHALVKVNCAALPPTLIERELFGHEKAAFTGATATRPGRFELADGGSSSSTRSPSFPSSSSPSSCASSRTASSSAWAAPARTRWTCGSWPLRTAISSGPSARATSATISTTAWPRFPFTSRRSATGARTSRSSSGPSSSAARWLSAAGSTRYPGA